VIEGIKRGRMSPDEKAEIERLALALKKPTPSVIARRINRHPATVAWFMITRGLIERKVRYAPAKVGRRPDGTAINRYTSEQDGRLVALRREGKSHRQIAEIVTQEFGVPRNLHSVQVRIIMLAAFEGGPEP
jgi:IS30 family transposase